MATWRGLSEDDIKGLSQEERWAKLNELVAKENEERICARIRWQIEGENMEDEDNDVRFDHFDSRAWRRFPHGACWLCRRPFSDSSEDEQTGDMLGSLGVVSTRIHALF